MDLALNLWTVNTLYSFFKAFLLLEMLIFVDKFLSVITQLVAAETYFPTTLYHAIVYRW